MNRRRSNLLLVVALLVLSPAACVGQEGAAEWAPEPPGLLGSTSPPQMASSRPDRTARTARRASRAASAILIRNPDTRGGEPPFALADQFGRVQRYVEPSLGVDLNRYIGQIVSVEHDTGRTLLASQLRFGAEQLTPLAERPPIPAAVGVATLAAPLNRTPPARAVIITQFEERPASGPAERAAVEPIPEPPTPEPIVLEDLIGDPVISPVEGLPLPAAPAEPVVSPIDVIAGAAASPDNAGGGSACLTPGCGCCDTASPDLFFEAELLLLRMFNSQPTVVSDSYETGSRFTLGAKTRDGAHWLARYLEYENQGYDTGNNTNDLSLEMYNLEYGRTFNLGCRWTGLFTLGGQLTEFRDTAGPVDYGDAIGPAVGAQLRGPRWGAIHPLLGARHSLQFGEAATAAGGRFGSFSTTELAAGVEYQQRNGGSTVFGRAAIESVLVDGAALGDSGNTALFGFGLSLGIAR